MHLNERTVEFKHPDQEMRSCCCLHKELNHMGWYRSMEVVVEHCVKEKLDHMPQINITSFAPSMNLRANDTRSSKNVLTAILIVEFWRRSTILLATWTLISEGLAKKKSFDSFFAVEFSFISKDISWTIVCWFEYLRDHSSIGYAWIMNTRED